MKVYITDQNNGDDLAVVDLPVIPEVGENIYIESDTNQLGCVVTARYWMVDISADKANNPPYVVLKVARRAS